MLIQNALKLKAGAIVVAAPIELNSLPIAAPRKPIDFLEPMNISGSLSPQSFGMYDPGMNVPCIKAQLATNRSLTTQYSDLVKLLDDCHVQYKEESDNLPSIHERAQRQLTLQNRIDDKAKSIKKYIADQEEKILIQICTVLAAEAKLQKLDAVTFKLPGDKVVTGPRDVDLTPAVVNKLCLAHPTNEQPKLQSSPAAMSSADVSIEVKPPTASYKYYDPAGAKPPECKFFFAGNTGHNYRWDVSYNNDFSKKGDQTTIQIRSINVSLTLDTLITLPNNASPSLRTHYEGYRKIYEYFYQQFAARSAELAAALLVGERFSSSAPDDATARQQIKNQILKRFQDQYLKHTGNAADDAVNCFNHLTSIGRLTDDCNEAVNYAIGRCRVPMLVAD